MDLFSPPAWQKLNRWVLPALVGPLGGTWEPLLTKQGHSHLKAHDPGRAPELNSPWAPPGITGPHDPGQAPGLCEELNSPWKRTCGKVCSAVRCLVEAGGEDRHSRAWAAVQASERMLPEPQEIPDLTPSQTCQIRICLLLTIRPRVKGKP